MLLIECANHKVIPGHFNKVALFDDEQQASIIWRRIGPSFGLEECMHLDLRRVHEA